MPRDIAYFAYGTLQKGLPNYPKLAHVVGEPVGRFRTVRPHGLVVPRSAVCGNPGCNLLHRMAALVPDIADMQVEGDLFLIDEDGLAALDRLEGYVEEGTGPYVRRRTELEATDGSRRCHAEAFRVRNPEPWRLLVERELADVVARYTPDLAVNATLKPCCAARPGHDGPHDVTDPLAPVLPIR